MKTYVKPELEVIVLPKNDVICDSGDKSDVVFSGEKHACTMDDDMRGMMG